MMVDDLWLVNKTAKTETRTIVQLRKVFKFEPYRPVKLPRDVAMCYIDGSLKICDNPDQYYRDTPLKHLTIRDAGIGDLLLLEPCLRESKRQGNREVHILSRYPEVYENNPYIDKSHRQNDKRDIPINRAEFDADDDLRNYSETCPERDRKHRTDCYNQIYKLTMDAEAKQPRLYFSDVEMMPALKKKNGYKYVGVSLDASHHYRRYERCEEAIEYMLREMPDVIFVILGGYEYFRAPKHKRVIDKQGKTGLRETFRIVRDMDMMICADSGIMHVAMAMHVPTVCIFSIIQPHLRLGYYTGPREVIYENGGCGGCGSLHMAICKHGDKTQGDSFMVPCMDIDPGVFVEKLNALKLQDFRRVFESTKTEEQRQNSVNVNLLPEQKLTMPIIVQDEAKNLPRFVELVMSHKAIGRVVAIDGGSQDNTVKLLEKAGAEVYTHAYLSSYHDAQAMQRNISCSYVPDGEKIIIMDIDECFSQDLSDWLHRFANENIEYGLLSRRTFNYFADITDPHKAIKDYPDWQPRLFTWNRRFKWVGSPHHAILNTPTPVRIQRDIIHFEREGKDRDALEAKWSAMQAKTKAVYG